MVRNEATATLPLSFAAPRPARSSILFNSQILCVFCDLKTGKQLRVGRLEVHYRFYAIGPIKDAEGGPSLDKLPPRILFGRYTRLHSIRRRRLSCRGGAAARAHIERRDSRT